jgi:excisionase family DNA binding protein
VTDAPMPLAVAIERCFPHGGATVSTLRSAIRAGDLRCRFVGRSYLVTQADIDTWMTKCQDTAKARTFTSDAARAARQSGSSRMERMRLAQDALTLMLKTSDSKSSRHTAQRNSGQTPTNAS